MRQQVTDQSLLREEAIPQTPVECLGMMFENYEARRAYFLDKLREGLEELHTKLSGVPFTTVEDAVARMQSIEKWPMRDETRVREIAEQMRHAAAGKDMLQRWKDEVGFPHGEIEDILRLSDPPYYTACPNLFVKEYIKYHGRLYNAGEDDYYREPFAADVQEGRHEPVYLAHTYHAKVPYRAVMRYILAYTDPGDIIYDGLAGTGMVGVACQLAADPPEDLKSKLEKEIPNAKFGARIPYVSDLSPIAGFIASAYNLPLNPDCFRQDAEAVLREAAEEVGFLYQTSDEKGQKCEVKYYVWSDVFSCPYCGEHLDYGRCAYDPQNRTFNDEFPCPKCKAILDKGNLERVFETIFDPFIEKTVRRVKQSLLLTSFVDQTGRRRHEAPNRFDLDLVAQIEKLPIPSDIPCHEIPYMHMTHERNNLPALGVTHIHHFFTRRNLITIHALFLAVLRRPQPNRRALLFWLTSCLPKLSRLMNYNADGIGRVTKGIFYFSSVSQEASPFHLLDRAINDIKSCFATLSKAKSYAIVSVGDASASMVQDNSIDYIFTDPPFGGNIYYADLNYLWEVWLRVYTNRMDEAIVSITDSKDIQFYTNKMSEIFREYYRILKPSRWITVEFHNSKNAIWMAIQEALGRAGFVIADVRTLDKKLGTFKQITVASTPRQDLVISAYKPALTLEGGFALGLHTEEAVWDFVRSHLRKLPIFVSRNGRAEVIAERQPYLLFDRMVAFHVQRGLFVPISAVEFYTGLKQRFPERDGMYFLPEQAVQYDKRRMTVKEILQIELFVTDESSAIQWLRQQLTRKPQTFQEIHPQFLRELGGWQKHEKPLELFELLEENFLRYDGRGPIPEQIWSWMQKSATLRERMKGQDRESADAPLRLEAKDRWYVPDPNKAQDLEKLRERNLLREFEEYQASKGRQLKVFRLEAVRAGFKKAWAERDYLTILDVSRKIPEQVLQEDPKLLMWYDQALTRTGGEA